MTSLRSVSQRLVGALTRPRGQRDAAPAHWIARRRGLVAVGVAASLLGTLDVWLWTCGFSGCPSPAEIRSFRPTEGSKVYDRHGNLLGRLTYVRRVNVSLGAVPLHVRRAFLATEDRRFYEHGGVDWRAVGRALVRNVRAIGIREGFSTITMQVARNTFVPGLTRERSLRRKLLELRLAGLLERTLTKDQILELYLNVIYLGNGTYGVEAASRDLFGKGVRRLSLAEAATLAALPKGPSMYTPRRHPKRAKRRRDLVLALMAREGYLSPRRAAHTASQPLKLAATGWRPKVSGSFALDAIRTVVDSILGPNAARFGDVVVHTTIDARAQRAAQRAVATQAARIQRQSDDWYGEDKAEVQGALVALDPRTGDVRALVGGRRYKRRGFNRALAAHRQPGSAFKPFVYAAALSAGFTPASAVDDTPIEIEQDGRVWTPDNYGGEYGGRLTLRRALMQSSNAAAVRVSRAVGESHVVDVARRSGIRSPLPAVPSIALGALEVTPLELVTAYAPFANGGYRMRPRLVRRIEASDGTVLWSNEIVARTRVLAAVDAYQLTSMLRSAVDRGTGHIVRELGARGPIAGKTGTTNRGTDVWFVGYTPTLVAGVWFGYDAPRPLAGDASGGRLAAPAWVQFYQRGWREDGSETAWAPPAGLRMRLVDPETGALATDWCPLAQREWFKPGTEPTEHCAAHEAPRDEWEEFEEWLGERVARALGRLFRF